jgi:RimJ/RimL family protein N-acetyltransferase
MTDRKEIPRLVAKIHPDNISSRKVLVKAGAREGEVIKDAYARFVDQGRKSDDYCWYLDRPTSRFGASPRMV